MKAASSPREIEPAELKALQSRHRNQRLTDLFERIEEPAMQRISQELEIPSLWEKPNAGRGYHRNEE